MKPYIYFVFALCSLLAAGQSNAASEIANKDLVYVIPIEDMIERGLVYVIRRGVDEAVSRGASAIIFDMNTPGGRVDAAEDIIDIIANIKVKTYTFVNPRAISAGAILALATDEIYMAPGSSIGDAMPLLMSPIGSPQEIPSSIEEKMVSYVAGLIRSTAQRKNHDPKLAESMVRRGAEYKIEDDVICPTNQILTLTNVEASRLVGKEGEKRPLLSKGTVESLDALLEKIGHPKSKSEIVRFNVTVEEKIARYIEMFSALFLIGGLLGLYIEFKTPGVILPGIIGVLLLAIWFWGYHIAGLAGMWQIIMFMIGLILLASEIFLFPGTVLPGLVGTAFIVASLLMSMIGHYPGMPWHPITKNIPHAITVLSSSVVVTFVIGWLLAKYLPETSAFQQFMLLSSESKADGFHASREQTHTLVGLQGKAVSELRPAGMAQFGDKRIDVVTRGEYIDKGAPIVVAETHGNRIVVECAQKQKTS
jgi:membrane-bound serine protease (ClpP class)